MTRAPHGSTEQAAPAEHLTTRERGDMIQLTYHYTPGIGGVRLCLDLGKGIWWKRIEIGEPGRQSDKTEFRPGIEGDHKDPMDCMLVEPARPVVLYFRKAKEFGRKAGSVNEIFKDLTSWNDHTLTFSWLSDR